MIPILVGLVLIVGLALCTWLAWHLDSYMDRQRQKQIRDEIVHRAFMDDLARRVWRIKAPKHIRQWKDARDG